MSLVLYNTLTKSEEEFTPLEEGQVTMYTCGPTVYGRPHIGNYSSFLLADLLRRWLETGHGLQVTHVKNITDVGHLAGDDIADADGADKIERQAKEEQVDPLSIARKYAEQYLADEEALNLLEPHHRPLATETIPEMITMTESLIDSGHAYETEDGVYFDVTSFASYGSLSGNTLEDLSAGARIEVDENKRHPADFALWKKCVGPNEHHILRWESPWGEGFPGWHIECSCMSAKFLGDTFDIHTGGEDLIFPHHECEIAQSICSSGSEKASHVQYWVHKRFIDMGDAKMSKSLGNVLTLPDITAMGFSALDLRYYLLSVHYRTNLKFTQKGLEDAHKARRKIVEWMQEVRNAGSGNADVASEWMGKFSAAMDSDLNTPAALAVIFDAMTWSRTEGSLGDCTAFADQIEATFGCFEEEAEDIPQEVVDLAKQRIAARENKDFAESDRLRDEIATLGFEVKDTPEGQKVLKK